VKHVRPPVGPPICESEGSVERVVDATRAVFMDVECPACLRRAIAESEARLFVLRELLDKAEVLS
jgi:hypothetical protein